MAEYSVESELICEEEIIEIPLELYEGDEVLRVRIKPKKASKRTKLQNASLHLYCTRIAKKMTDAGITQRELVGRFKRGFELPVTGHMIKDVFRTVGEAMFKKKSTAKLTTVETQEVYKVVDERFGEVTGVRCEWPSRHGGRYE